MTLSVDHGTLTLDQTDGLTIIAGENGSSTMTFTGMPSDINAALNGLQYTPTSGYTGIANLQITTNDQAPTSAGGAKITSDTLGINVSLHPVGTESLVNTTTDGVQQTASASPHSVAADANGNYVVVWSSQSQDGSWNVFGQRFYSDGSANGGEFQINTQTGLNQVDAKVAMRDDGTFAVTWTEVDSTNASTSNVYLRSYDSNGVAIQDQELLVNESSTTDQKFSSVAINNSGIAVVWTGQNQAGTWDVYEKWFDVYGNVDRSEFQVNSTSSTAAMQTQTGMDPWGYIMAVWQTETNGQQDIFGRYMGYAANDPGFDTGEYLLTSSAAGNQYNPNLGFKTNQGNFIVSWTSDGSDGNPAGIYARQFDWWGNPTSSDFQVSSDTAGNQDHSAISVDKDTGDFVVTWTSDSGASTEIYSQYYNSNGNVDGPLTRVNTTTDGQQTNSSVTFLSPTDYVVAWSGNGTGDDAGVYSSICDMRLLRTSNLAPINTVPEAQTVDADSPLTFSLANQNQIQITDPNPYPTQQQVTLTVAHGTLTLLDTDGLSFTAGSNGTSTMTFQGMPDVINADLEGLRYLANVDFSGTDTLQVITNDMASIYIGGPKVDCDAVAINVLCRTPVASENLVNTTTDNVQQTAASPPIRSPPTSMETMSSSGRAGARMAAGTSSDNATIRTASPRETSSKSIRTPLRPAGRQGRHAKGRHLRRHLDGEQRRCCRHGRRLSANLWRQRHGLAETRVSCVNDTNGRRPVGPRP